MTRTLDPASIPKARRPASSTMISTAHLQVMSSMSVYIYVYKGMHPVSSAYIYSLFLPFTLNETPKVDLENCMLTYMWHGMCTSLPRCDAASFVHNQLRHTPARLHMHGIHTHTTYDIHTLSLSICIYIHIYIYIYLFTHAVYLAQAPAAPHRHKQGRRYAVIQQHARSQPSFPMLSDAADEGEEHHLRALESHMFLVCVLWLRRYTGERLVFVHTQCSFTPVQASKVFGARCPNPQTREPFVAMQ